MTLTEDWRVGRESGFPLCCIVWYVAVWKHIYRFWPDLGSRLAFLIDRIVGFGFVYNRTTDTYTFTPKPKGHVSRAMCPLCISAIALKRRWS